MNKIRMLLLTAVGVWLLIPLRGAEIFVVNSASRTLSRIDTVSGETNNSFAQLGLTPNLMDMDEDFIYVVCSGDNAIQVLSRSSGAHIRYLPVAASSNPYDVLKVGEFLYVSGLFTNKVYKISLQSNSVVGSLQVGTAPQGLSQDAGRLFVCNTGGYASNYAGSSISVIDLESFSVTATLPVWTNPQYAIVRNGFLHVSCSGNWTNISGKVDVLDLADLTLEARLDIGGNPGGVWIDSNGTAYLGDGLGLGLYSYNANTYEVYHNAANPLDYDAFVVSGNAEMLALLEQNWSGNSVVRTYLPDFTPLAVYTVGYSSTDFVVVEAAPSANDDPQLSPALQFYPNPLPQGGVLRLDKPLSAAAELTLFNLRGQVLQKHALSRGESSLRLGKLPAGVYLYQLRWNNQHQTGKILICAY